MKTRNGPGVCVCACVRVLWLCVCVCVSSGGDLGCVGVMVSVSAVERGGGEAYGIYINIYSHHI